MLNPLIENAYKVLDGKDLSREEALNLCLEIRGTEILDLISLANKVRAKFAPWAPPCSILNAKSGRCAQNCRFCAQSAHHSAKIETYPLLAKEEALDAAKRAVDAGVGKFGYVTSGRGYPEPDAEFLSILDTFDAIHRQYPELSICASLGILSRETAKMLSEHHVVRYNMNLQTAPSRYAELIATTHALEEKIQTIRFLQDCGMEICCGGIFGLGEDWRDRVEMAFAIRELKVEGSPLNILLPIPGTPLEKREIMHPCDAAKSFAVFRLVNPRIMLKFAAGRESVMKDFQGLLMLSGLNALMTGGYLTTRGRDVEEDARFAASLAEF